MRSWDSYLAALGELDEVRREAATTVAAQQLAAKNAGEELGGVRARIALQRNRLTEMATRATRTVPVVEPLETERGAAAAVVASVTSDPTPGITAALQGVRATLDAADATLAASATTPGQGGPLGDWPPAARHGLVYGWYATLALVALMEISAIAGGSPPAQLVVVLFALLVPAGAWLLGWVSVRLLFGRGALGSAGAPPGFAGGAIDDGGRGTHGALLGAAICTVPLLVGMVLAIA